MSDKFGYSDVNFYGTKKCRSQNYVPPFSEKKKQKQNDFKCGNRKLSKNISNL